MAGLPTGTVTFLFTDLEGSTRLWEEHPDAMRDALSRHDEILRAAVEEHDGHVVKTTGDGLHAVFGAARDAVGAAIDAQQALHAEEWPLPEPLRVRMGVHTGEAEIRAGDYYGSAVNRAARVSAAAHGGQLLVSTASMEVVRDALDDELAVVDLGEHRLRDLGRPEHLFQLSVKGLESEFAPVRSLDAFPSNLRPQMTTFLGRSDQVASLRTLLDTAPLVTLVGVGGVGKTRLALQMAAEVLPYRRDGAWLAELAAVSDPDVIPDVVGAALRVRQREGMTMAASIVDFLRLKDLMLVLDNCEHVVAAASELVADIVEGCPGVTVVATSREALGVHGEQLWPVTSLPMPRAGDDAATAVGVASVRLFIDRARLVRPDFSLSDVNVTSVVEVCRRLDGIPLAIELAAARAGSLSPAQIAARLDERFRLLTGGKRSAVERHQTLRSTVDWSFDLLDEPAQRVFERLGVFAGGFTLEAAEAVAADEAIDVLQVLDELVAKSMVVAEDTGDDIRYRLHETLRQYARERLDEHGDADAVRRRHAGFYGDFVAQACARLMTEDDIGWMQRVTCEIENLRVAVTWAADAGEPGLAAALVAPLLPVSTFRQDWGIEALAQVAGDVPGASREPQYPEVCAIRGFAANLRGDFDTALHFGDLALDTLRERGEPDRYLPLYYRVSIAGWTGTSEEVSRILDRARRAPDRDGWLAFGYLSGEVTLAAAANVAPPWLLEDAETGLRLARDLGMPTSLAVAHYALGRVLEPSAPDLAGEHYVSSLEAASKVPGSLHIEMALSRLVAVHARAQRVPEAMRVLVDALVAGRAIGLRAMIVWSLCHAVSALVATSELDVAARVCGVLDAGVISIHPANLRDREQYEAAHARAREVLGADAFDALAAEGAAMNYDQALDWIIGEAERIAGADHA